MASKEEKRRKRIKVVASTVFAGIFIASIVVIGLIFSQKQETTIEQEWYKKATIYHIYVPSFKDSDGDGFGDLQGILNEIDYIKGLGVDTVWLSSLYKNGKDDTDVMQNYEWDDIIDHMSVGKTVGTDEVLKQLLTAFEENGLKVILDFIPNHTSAEHTWFNQSCYKTNGKENFYIWKNKADRNNWKMIGNNETQSAWTCDTCDQRPGECYLHNFLEEMPDLNLKEGAVVTELKNIMNDLLKMPAVSGFHIGNIDLLIEDEVQNNETVTTDYDATINFLKDVMKDHQDNLFLLELTKGDSLSESTERFAELTSPSVQIPFNFGNVDWSILDDKQMKKPGVDIKKAISGYLQWVESEEESDEKEAQSPSWEMNNCELTTSSYGFKFGRIYEDTHDIVMMMNILLPGTTVVYYGDEIGMTGFQDEIAKADTRDPYVSVNCEESDEKCYLGKSRDPMRTPMQWTENGEDMWLPYFGSSNLYNVKTEEEMPEEDKRRKRNPLELFKRLVTLKKFPAISEGYLFYPWQDNEIFSFMSKHEDEEFAYLVAMNVGSNNGSEPVNLDFTSVWPEMPKKGLLYTMAGPVSFPGNETYQYEKDTHVHMDDIELYPYQGMIVELNLAPEEEHDAWACQYCNGE